MEWQQIVFMVLQIAGWSVIAAGTYLLLGLTIADELGFLDGSGGWNDRLVVVIWPGIVMFGLVIVVGRLLAKTISWGVGE